MIVYETFTTEKLTIPTWSVEDRLSVLVQVHRLLHVVRGLGGSRLTLRSLPGIPLLGHLLEQTLSRHGGAVSVIHGDVQHAAHSDTRGKGVQTIVQNRAGVVAQQRIVVVLPRRRLGGERLGPSRVAVERQQGVGGLNRAEDGGISRRGGAGHVLGQQWSRGLSTVQRLGGQFLQIKRVEND